MMAKSDGQSLSVEFLRIKYESVESEWRERGKLNASVKMGRALSWTERASGETADPDAAFTFYWIAFESVYSGRSTRPATKEMINTFLGDVVALDRRNVIYSEVIAKESKAILSLVANPYVFEPFWDGYYRYARRSDWRTELMSSVNKTIGYLDVGASETLNTLRILFERLRVLRNQLVHGGATWNDAVNRPQVEDGARVMSRLMPILLNLMIDNPDSFDAKVHSPPPTMDPDWITYEAQMHMRRLARMAVRMGQNHHAAALRDAIYRELKNSEDHHFADSIRDLLT